MSESRENSGDNDRRGGSEEIDDGHRASRDRRRGRDDRHRSRERSPRRDRRRDTPSRDERGRSDPDLASSRDQYYQRSEPDHLTTDQGGHNQGKWSDRDRVAFDYGTYYRDGYIHEDTICHLYLRYYSVVIHHTVLVENNNNSGYIKLYVDIFISMDSEFMHRLT